MAGRILRLERGDHTLQRTALAHEAFLRLFALQQGKILPEREFLSLAAHKMRQILVDHARRRRSKKRGGDLTRVSESESDQGFARDEVYVLAIDEALTRLGNIDARAASVVELKFFCGHTNEEVAELLGVSDGTIESDWQFARSWLFGILKDNDRRSRI